MAIREIHTYLVHPNKQSEYPREICGTSVPLRGPLFELLDDIYRRSDEECEIDITFSHAADGSQQNEFRDLLREYLDNPAMDRCRKIAERLGQSTDRRSGLGLLFLIAGREGKEHKIVISRFPTDIAVYVDEKPGAFTIEFLERVFLKNRTSYKAVVYRGESLKAGFWNGRATDRQINSRVREASNYWIAEFLESQYKITAAAGTLRLARAMRDGAQKASLEVKQEIYAAATLVRGLEGKTLSINDLGERFNLSQEARVAITAVLKGPSLAEEQFQFDLVEFERVNAFRSIELSNGGTLTAPSSSFDDVFDRELMNQTEGRVRFVTEGRIVNERLRSRA